MRIAHLTWSLGVGGTQTMLADIVNIQVNEGHEVGIFEVDTYVSEYIVNKIDPRVKIFYLGRTRGKKQILPFIRLNWHLWKFNPDIIHSHAGALAKILITKKPMIATVHGVKSFPSEFTRYKYIYAISKAVQEDIQKKGRGDIMLNANGIACSEIKEKEDYSIRKELHIVQVSRIYINVKGQDIVVKALRRVQDCLNENPKCPVKKVIVHFVGDGIDTDKLKAMVYELDLNNNVVFEGFCDRDWLYEHLRDFDLFIQASRWEGFGLTVAEACAAKLPVLISDIDGPLEIIDGGKLGMTFKSENIDELVSKILSFINGEYDYSMIKPAYDRVYEMYSIDRTAKMYMQEYKRVLDEKK